MKIINGVIAKLFVASFIILFSSCATNDDKTGKRVSSKFDDFIDAAKIHSEALDIYYNDILAAGDGFTKTMSEGTALKELDKSVEGIINDIVSTDCRLRDLVEKYDLSDIVTTKSSDEAMTRLQTYMQSVLNDLQNIDDEIELKSEILRISDRNDFKSFSSEEQDHILFALAIYFDSFSYWEDNIDKWCNVTGVDYTVTTRGHIPPGEREWYRNSAKKQYAQTDAWGMVGGGIFGAIGGLGGFLIGWVSGAVWSSIGTALGY